MPLRVISLDTATEYDPDSMPSIKRTGARRPNYKECLLLIPQLLLGTEAAEYEMQGMPTRTRQRYLQRCAQYHKPRIGRPWAT